MCVVAHPDDECFAFGGALALAAKRGVETSVVCLTDGKAATNRGEAGSNEALGRMRREEFGRSCAVLGVAHHELLDYEDGQLEFVTFSTAAGRLVERIRTFKPHVLLTFGGDGAVNTHPDHTVVSALTTAAYHWARQPKRYPEAGEAHGAERLFYLTTNFFVPERQPPHPAPWTVTLDIRGVREQKSRAFEEHASQAPLMEATRSLFERYGAEEFYVLAASPEWGPAIQTTDFFEGLTA